MPEWLRELKLKVAFAQASRTFGTALHSGLTTDYYKDVQRRWKQAKKSDLLCEHV